MSANQGIDIGAILNSIGQFLVSFFNVLVEHAPLIMAVTIAGYLVFRYARTIRTAISQLIGLL